jgi:hypothetical protein
MLVRSFDADDVPVELGACYCPGAPHADGDVVYLAPALSMAGGMAAQAAISEGFTDTLKLQELLATIWCRYGVTGWNLLDEDGQPIPVNADNIGRALPYGKGGRLVAEKADDLYAEDILAPLVQRLSNTSPTGRTNGSTSRTRKRTAPQP